MDNQAIDEKEIIIRKLHGDTVKSNTGCKKSARTILCPRA